MNYVNLSVNIWEIIVDINNQFCTKIYPHINVKFKM